MNFSSNPPVVAECKDTSEKIDLYETYGLYIKPIARLNLTIQLPPSKNPGQTVSNAEIIDKLKKQIQPEEFIFLRVIKSTLEFIRCEGEIENKSGLKNLLGKLDGCSIRMNSYTDVLKVRAAEAKIAYPMRHDWDSFFKDSQNPLNELKAGERPDTVHLMDIPCKWFADKKAVGELAERPSETVLKEVFSIFGELRMVDIPAISNMSLSLFGSGLKKQTSYADLNMSPSASQNQNINTFEAFVQYKDYISFVKAMDTFRGMKLLYIDETKNAYTANIRVDFDRTRHLSDKEIKKREIDKLKAIEMEKIKNAQLEKEKEKEAKQKEIANFRMLLEESIGDNSNDGIKGSNTDEKSKEQRRREREEARRQKRLAKKQQEEKKKFDLKIALEERKILIAQRKIESMRLLEELFNRVKVVVAQEELEKRQKEMKEAEYKRELEEENQEKLKKIKLEQEEQELKEKIQKNLNKKLEESIVTKVEEVEFELRKKPLKTNDNETTSSPSNPDTNLTQVAMPRVVMLSNPQLQQQPFQKLKLYDEDIMENEKIKTNEINFDEKNENSQKEISGENNFETEPTNFDENSQQKINNNDDSTNQKEYNSNENSTLNESNNNESNTNIDEMQQEDNCESNLDETDENRKVENDNNENTSLKEKSLSEEDVDN